MAKFFLGLIAGIGIAYLAYRAHALNRKGATAAAIMGAIIFGLGGVGWAIVLLTFFISSSALSNVFKKSKQTLHQQFAKGSQRDAGQVAANGGPAGIITLLFFVIHSINPENQILPFLWIAFGASLAAANADTWATELGVLNPHQPILLTNFQRVPKGTSGAVSLVGTLAAAVGSALVAGIAILIHLAGWGPVTNISVGNQFLLITSGGIMGAFIDSLLGATIQSIFFCPVCQKETEHHPLHSCGTTTTLIKGIGWFNNDIVNTACTTGAALTALFFAFLINAV